jgi:hypothetical protein
MALVSKAGYADTSHAGLAEPQAYTIPAGLELRGFDTILRVRPLTISLEMNAPASLESATDGVALFHLDEGEMIQPGEEGLFSPSTGFTPGKPYLIKVRVSPKAPVRWDGSTVLVHFDVPRGTDFPAGQTGNLKLSARVRDKLAIEESAVLRDPEGAYVLVTSQDRRTLTKRRVEVGRKQAGYVTIVSGLSEGEYALAKHTFVLDLERRLARASTIQ